jgi:hypothetical protein
MAIQWFVEQGQRVYGPFDASRLRKLAAAGKISAESGVSRSKDGPWVKAGQLRGLFPGETDDRNGKEVLQGSSRQDGDVQSGGEQKTWMYKCDGDVRGPVSKTEINRLIAEGQIVKTTLVLRVGQTHWETAFSAGLFLDAPVQGQGQTGVGPPAESAEAVLWVGKPAHAANKAFYTLCTMGAPFLVPAWWGLQRYVKTDATRYQVTNRRVRIRTGLFSKERTDIPLGLIRDARLTTPWRLRGTRLCNIELFGEDTSSPLAVLAAIPVDESALVVSLCEAGADHQINVHVTQRIVAAAARQERARMQAEMRSHTEEMRRLRNELVSERKRLQEERASQSKDTASQFWVPYDDLDEGLGWPGIAAKEKDSPPGTGWPSQKPSSEAKSDGSNTSTVLWNVFCRGALSFVPVPPPVTMRRRPASRLTAAAVILGRRRKKTVRVKGHYRGRKWIAAHDREVS